MRRALAAAEHAHARLVKQTIDQPLARQRRVDQFDIFDGRYQRAAFDPGIVLRHGVRRGAFRRIAGIEIGDARALRRLRQKLQQDAAGAPAMLGAAFACAQFLGHRQPHPRRDLLGADENIRARRLPASRPRAPPGPGSGSCPAPGRWSWRDGPCRAARRRRPCRRRSLRRRASLSKRAQARTLSGAVKSTTSMRTGPSLCVCKIKRPSIFKRRAEHDGQHHRLAQQAWRPAAG